MNLIPRASSPLPDHTQLPETDGRMVENIQEHPQSRLLTETLEPVLRRLHPDGHYALGRDSAIYWRHTDPPLEGMKGPDWFYVPGVPPLLNGQIRRSYVLWQERVVPVIALEYVSGDGQEERDRTPLTGKFWVYERGICIPFYGIFEQGPPLLEVYHLDRGGYRRMPATRQGRYPIPPLRVELGLWRGVWENLEANWLRWWDRRGRLLPTAEERAARDRRGRERERQARRQAEQVLEAERQGREKAERQAESERQARERLAAKLRELGIDPEQV